MNHPSSMYAQRDPSVAALPQDDDPRRVVTFREFVQSGLSPRMLAQAIAERCGRERISEVFLSPDAFAHRTAEASIAEQLGEVLAYYGLPRPAPADDDRVGGWQYMYQLLESDSWLITQNCARLIDCLPRLVRDERYIEDVRKMDGDDPADAARYGLVSGGRFAGVGAGPSYGGTFRASDFARPGAYGQPGAAHTPPNFPAARDSGAAQSDSAVGAQLYPERSRRDAAPHLGTHDAREVVGGRFSASVPERQRGHATGPPRFIIGMPLSEQIKRQITATDATSVAIHSQRLEAEARKHFRPNPLPRRRK